MWTNFVVSSGTLLYLGSRTTTKTLRQTTCAVPYGWDGGTGESTAFLIRSTTRSWRLHACPRIYASSCTSRKIATLVMYSCVDAQKVKLIIFFILDKIASGAPGRAHITSCRGPTRHTEVRCFPELVPKAHKYGRSPRGNYILRNLYCCGTSHLCYGRLLDYRVQCRTYSGRAPNTVGQKSHFWRKIYCTLRLAREIYLLPEARALHGPQQHPSEEQCTGLSTPKLENDYLGRLSSAGRVSVRNQYTSGNDSSDKPPPTTLGSR